jgi:CBS domain-containing protein
MNRTERDLFRQIHQSLMIEERYSYNSSHISSPIVTIDAISAVEAAADIMIQTKVRHLLVFSKERY